MSESLRDRLCKIIDRQNVSEYCGGIHPEDVIRLGHHMEGRR